LGMNDTGPHAPICLPQGALTNTVSVSTSNNSSRVFAAEKGLQLSWNPLGSRQFWGPREQQVFRLFQPGLDRRQDYGLTARLVVSRNRNQRRRLTYNVSKVWLIRLFTSEDDSSL
jgi:hypothetical protein